MLNGIRNQWKPLLFLCALRSHFSPLPGLAQLVFLLAWGHPLILLNLAHHGLFGCSSFIGSINWSFWSCVIHEWEATSEKFVTGRSRTLLWDESFLKVILVDPLTLSEKSMTTFVSLLYLAFIHEKILLLLTSNRKNRSEECCKGLWPCDYAVLMLSVTHNDDRKQHFLFHPATMLSEQGWSRGKQWLSDSSITLQKARWWGLNTVAS